MAIQMTCACGTNLSFEDAQLGQSGPCYKCGQTLTVAPTPPPAQAMSPMAPPAPMHGPPAAFPQAQYSSRGDAVSEKEGWSWRYSRLFGVMYGPIPVGIIVVVIGLIVFAAVS